MAINLKPADISAIIKKQLADYETKSLTYEVGVVLSGTDGIARVHGLSNVMSGELVEFSSGVSGMAMNLEEDNVGIAIFGEDKYVKEGDQVKRTERIASVPVGEALVGRIVDALGNAIDGNTPIAAKEF